MEKKSDAIPIIIEMLDQRGYTIISNKDGHLLAEKPDETIVCVFCNIVLDLAISNLRDFISSLHNMKINHGIIIYSGDTTPSAKNMLKTSNEIMILEAFSESDLQFNPTKHRLVPEMAILSRDDTKKFKELYGTQIPKMKCNDSIVRFMGWGKGDIIKIVYPREIKYNIIV